MGQKEPNLWALYDMHGNVDEWTRDWYSENYYSTSPSSDPKGPNGGSFRVVRGGSWPDSAVYCRSAVRYRSAPDYLSDNIGFRLALSTE